MYIVVSPRCLRHRVCMVLSHFIAMKSSLFIITLCICLCICSAISVNRRWDASESLDIRTVHNGDGMH